MSGASGSPLGRRQAGDDRLQHRVDIEAGLGGDLDRMRGVEPDHVLDLLLDLVRLGGGQVDLVEDRHDLVIVVERLVDIGERLRLDALARIDHEQRALAGRERAVHLIGEIDMPGRVDQVEHIVLAVVRAIGEAHGLRLDGDAALALDVHRVRAPARAHPFRARRDRPWSGSGGRRASICRGRYAQRSRNCGCFRSDEWPCPACSNAEVRREARQSRARREPKEVQDR